MRCFPAWGIILLSAAAAMPAEPTLAVFKPATRQGYFDFNTGALSGTLRLDGKSQGISELIHVESGSEVTYGGGHVGLFSPYRVFSTAGRYGNAARDWPSVARLLPDGAVEVTFPPGEDHPLELTAVYRWAGPETLDVRTTVKPLVEMPDFEVFWSNYFAPGFEVSVYVKPPYLARDQASVLLPADFHPLTEGNYLIFPRDRQATRIIFDGRWELPPHPVHWSVNRPMAAPLAIRRHRATGLTAAIMAPPDDCFALATPYNKTPPDGVAGHRSLYLSLFGRDLPKGQTAVARMRLLIRASLSDQQAIDFYHAYLAEQEP